MPTDEQLKVIEAIRPKTTDSGPPPNLKPCDGQIRPLTQQLIHSAIFDTWPGNAAVLDFGIDSDRHLGALHHAIRHGEVSPQELDAAMGSGAKLTEIVRRGKNPYCDVTFKTSWDLMSLESVAPKATLSDFFRGPVDTRSGFDRSLNDAQKRAKSESPERDDGGRVL
jgi:hypothetical protein